MVVMILLSIIELIIAIITILFLWKGIVYIVNTNNRLNSYNKLQLSKEEQKELIRLRIKLNVTLIISYLLLLLFNAVIFACIYIIIYNINS
jgi:hypothetical protein